MSDDGNFFKIHAKGDEAIEQGFEAGVDIVHIFQHLYGTALCTLGSPEAFDYGLYIEFTDIKDRVWTFSIVPPDGGFISDGLIELALERE